MKAIIPAAGHGTRFFPVSKSIPKEMLPIGNKPAIQWIAEEAIEAGADEVIIITSPEKPVIRSYFTVDPRWESHLCDRSEALAALRELDSLSIRIRFVEQTVQKGLGHAVLQAAGFCSSEKEPVLILLGDALVLGERSASSEMVTISRKRQGASVVGLEVVPWEKVSRYGIIDGVEQEKNVYAIDRLCEKPARNAAPSNLAIAGRYLLDVRIFRHLAAAKPGHGGEIQLTDAIQQLLTDTPVYGCRYEGRRCDIGNPLGYRQALDAFDR